MEVNIIHQQIKIGDHDTVSSILNCGLEIFCVTALYLKCRHIRYLYGCEEIELIKFILCGEYFLLVIVQSLTVTILLKPI